jgi:hypothetical protein
VRIGVGAVEDVGDEDERVILVGTYALLLTRCGSYVVMAGCAIPLVQVDMKEATASVLHARSCCRTQYCISIFAGTCDVGMQSTNDNLTATMIEKQFTIVKDIAQYVDLREI